MLDPDLFRSALGRFASGVAVVTTADANRRPHGMTVNAFCSVSLAPPLVLMCIDRQASMYSVLRETGHFVVNVLSSTQEAISRRFADVEDGERFDGIGYQAARRGAAILDDVITYLECDLIRCDDVGDHGIFVGEVEHAVILEGAPLLYYRSGYARLER